MNAFVALIKREYLEHSGAFLYSPLVVLALIVLFGLSMYFGSGSISMEMSGGNHSSSYEAQADGDDGIGHLVTALVLDAAGTTDEELSARMRSLMNLIAMPFYVVLFIISLFALIACLHDERKDRSVLFWKSMPVGDVESVTSKYVFIAWVAPLITIAAIFVAQLFTTLLLVGMVEDGMGSRVLMHSGVLISIVQILLGYIVNGLVVLPIFTWFMLVSGWAKSMPMVWALAVPFWLVVFESVIFDTEALRSFIGFHTRMPSLPGFSSEGEEPFIHVSVTSFGEQFAVLTQGQFWLGLLVGAGFLAACVYMRRVKNEI